MYELHKHEQYFFSRPTIEHLADFVAQYNYPCCLCAPLIGQELERRGIKACTLDIDSRFAQLRGYKYYDLARPEWLGETFGIIVCDPPFFNISLDRLFRAIRILSRYDYTQPLLICYLARRASNVVGTFCRFNLERINYKVEYQTIQSTDRNEVFLYGNLGASAHTQLASSTVAVTS